jgi:hypothetical protein
MNKTILYTSFSIILLFGLISYFSACKPDPCVTRAVECKHDGVCKDGDCLCEVGYEGDSCQFRVNEKFDSYYACIRTRITNGTLVEDNDDTLRVKALNDKLGIQFFSVRDSVFEVINGVVSGKDFKIPDQNKDFIFYLASYNGSGSLNNGVLTVTLNRSWLIGTVSYTSKTTYVGYKYQ